MLGVAPKTHGPLGFPKDEVMQFTLNNDANQRMAGTDLLIIDECSMVDEQIGRDLLSFGKLILVLGDPAQLPPVKNEGGFFTECGTRSHADRSASAGCGKYDRRHVHARAARRRFVLWRVGHSGNSYHSTNWLASIRERPKSSSARMRRGGRIMDLSAKHWGSRPNCLWLATSWSADGMSLKVSFGMARCGGCLTQTRSSKSEWARRKVTPACRLEIESLDEDREPVIVRVESEYLLHEKIHEFSGQFSRFLFGQALTVHLAQGSQSEDVMLINEAGYFRADAARWLYTGITRAAERLTIVT